MEGDLGIHSRPWSGPARVSRSHTGPVHRRQQVPEGLRRLAALQGGVVSRQQVLGHGLSDHVIARLVTGETWTPLGPGVYATAPGPSPWEGLAWAGVLLGGPAARLGPQASGFLHGLTAEPPATVDVLVPPTGPYRTAGPWQFIRETAGVRSARAPGSPPRLPLEDTVIDLTAVSDPRGVVQLVTRAVQSRRTQASRLAVVLDERRRHPHRRLMQALLGDVAAGAESPLELTYLRDVERAHGLPRGLRQASRRGLPYASDVGYDEWCLLVELDGRLGHEGEGRFRDMQRDNRFALTGLLTLRYGWIDVLDRPCLVAAQVTAALISRGWSGLPSRCPRCRHVPEDLVATA